MAEDPRWPRASAWLAGDHIPDPVARLAVLGAPVRFGSISGGRFDIAPIALRQVLERFGTWDGERDIRAVAATDLGDLPIEEHRPAREDDPVEGALKATEGFDARAVLGGDNSITRGGVRGVAGELARVGLLTLDAHHDLRDTAEGLTNGNPVRALLEEGLPGGSIAQIGIQPFANSGEYAAVAREHGIRVVTVDEVRRRGIDDVTRGALDAIARRADTIYVDLDLDVLDVAFAPACPGARPGGLLPHELHRAAFLAGAHPKVAAVDIVEVDPAREPGGSVTLMNAARCLLSFAAGLAARSG